ncbi:MAG: biopolymer transporter ExbD [Pseudomonadota bacterium]
MDFPRTRRKKIEIGLIPLIDVSMFLLIFFMVSGVVEKIDLIPIEPPVSQHGNMMDEGHILVLLGSHDEIIVNDEMVTMEEMQKMLTPELTANPAKVVTVKADAVVPANRMIEVMDAIKAAGGHHLSILTQSIAKVDKK